MEGTGKKTVEEIYKKLDQIDHILLRPDSYVGSIHCYEQENHWVWDGDLSSIVSGKIIQKKVKINPALYRIFDEIVVNARDHCFITENNCYNIYVTLKDNYFSVKNDGKGIDVVLHKDYDMYVPELIFGQLLTSSNYDDTQVRYTGGRNGYGAKLANIFSDHFCIETVDQINQLKFTQVYQNNMKDREKAIIVKSTEQSYTKITVFPSKEIFGEQCISEIICVFIKRLYDLAATLPGKNIYINQEKITFDSFRQYIYCYNFDTNIIYDETEFYKLGVIFCPDEGGSTSFINGVCTWGGGTHVDKIFDLILKCINKSLKTVKIKSTQLREHLYIFLDACISNPSFTTQSKEVYKASITVLSQWTLSDKIQQGLISLKIKEYIQELNRAREDLKHQTTLIKKTSPAIKSIHKLEDALLAGTKNSYKCKLILTEGDSAKALAMSARSLLPPEIYGIFPLRGKLLNVRTKGALLEKNQEINHLINILGLRYGKVYENTSELRYGAIIILTDQDLDGSHIKGLVLNFIDYFCPSLLSLNFIYSLYTPIIKVFIKKQECLTFYHKSNYNQWLKDSALQADKYQIKYYKGLGTSTRTEALEYFKDIQSKLIKYMIYDEHDKNAIKLAFDKKMRDARKDWILGYDPEKYLSPDDKVVSLNKFIHFDLIHYSIFDVKRSIPNLADGFKPSQRKILYTLFEKNIIASNSKKVIQLAGMISDFTCYHHGEESLSDTIVRMAQNYVGTNNINFLDPCGQFGTRLSGGSDSASPRYIFSHLTSITKYIFRAEDLPVLDFEYDDTQKIEPVYFVPIVPTILINGNKGVGTGFSTTIPLYNPLDIINNIYLMLEGEPIKNIIPWYKGFKGTINEIFPGSYQIRGCYNQIGNIVYVTELPIGRWTTEYKAILEELVESNFLEDYSNYSTDINVFFQLKTNDNAIFEMTRDEIYKKLKLETFISLNNLHLHSPLYNVLKKYTINEIFNEFYKLRIKCYDSRKKHKVSLLQEDLKVMKNKRTFIEMVISGSISVLKTPQHKIEEQLIKHDICPDPKKGGYQYLFSMPIHSLTSEKVQELIDLYDRKEKELIDITNKDIKTLWKEELKEFETYYKKLILVS
ncbi:putative DNA topoisomerase IIA [Namao virus]|nr:putative DNA topoisomerase IIA [Namao virus]